MEIKAEKSRYHRFSFYYDYTPDRVEFCRVLKESFGWNRFSFNHEDGLKRWVFSETLFIRLIKEHFPDVKIGADVLHAWKLEEGEIVEAKKVKEAVDEIKQKTETDFQVKGIRGEMYPYQKIGVEFLLASGGRAIIADPPGLGKTVQALGYAAHSKHKRVLVVCPASVKSAWVNEAKKWTNFSYEVIGPKTDVTKISADTNLWIINYDILKKFITEKKDKKGRSTGGELLKVRFDLLIADECHLVKNNTAQRTKAVRLLSKYIPHIVLLSGTPLLSRPVEMFTLLNMVDPRTWTNWYEFTRRYCGGHQGRWGYDSSGATNIEELHNRIKKYFIRRQKADVLTQLPPKNRIDMEIELDKEIQEQYDEAENNLVSYLQKYKGKQPAEIAKMVQAEKLAQLNVLRNLCALGSIGSATDVIESVIEADEKILVFSSFLEPLRILKEKFGDAAVVITGETKVEDRGKIVDEFQTNPNVKIFLGGMRSAGVGITLTAASNVLFLDYAWNPADHQQAEDRVHRPGQVAESVNIYQFAAKGTISDKLQKMLAKKRKVFDKVIEGKLPEKGDELEGVDEVVEDLLERRGAKWKPMQLT